VVEVKVSWQNYPAASFSEAGVTLKIQPSEKLGFKIVL
jgi:hypothetical protein